MKFLVKHKKSGKILGEYVTTFMRGRKRKMVKIRITKYPCSFYGYSTFIIDYDFDLVSIYRAPTKFERRLKKKFNTLKRWFRLNMF